MPEPLNIFVSYSHHDERWLKELQVHLAPLVRGEQIHLWDDTRIKAGARWKTQIEQALDKAHVVILLVSVYFLASDFIIKEELQLLLQAAKEKGVLILPIIIDHNRFRETESLSVFQAVNNPSRPLDGMRKTKRGEVFVRVTHLIEETWQRRQAQHTVEPEVSPMKMEAPAVAERPEAEAFELEGPETEAAVVEQEPLTVEEPKATAVAEADESAGVEVEEPETVLPEVKEKAGVDEEVLLEEAPQPPESVSYSAQIWRRVAKWGGSVAGIVVIVIMLVKILPSRLSPELCSPTQPPSQVESLTFDGMDFVKITKGTFQMGSTDGNSDEQPVRCVTITQPFYLGKYEVTQGQWEAVIGTTPWREEQFVQEGDSFPAVYVTWDRAQVFIERLNAQEGDTLYRLPTEVEWEFAARAGTTTTYSFGDDASELSEYAWYETNAGNAGEQYAHQVGLRRPNGWGLYDMHGNVWEWVEDWYNSKYYQSRETTDPKGSQELNSRRVFRGGSWSGTDWDARSAHRYSDRPGYSYDYLGFRLVREIR